MSLINEALKRTRASVPQAGVLPGLNPASVPVPAPVRRPAPYRVARGNRMAGLAMAGVALGAVLVMVLVHSLRQPPASALPAPAAIEAVPAPATGSSLPGSGSGGTIVDPGVASQLAQALRAEQAAAAVIPVSPPAPEVVMPKLVLQGITADQAGREALVNGHAVRVGDEIDGAQVTGIESRRVLLQWSGREIVLRMP